MVEEEVDEVDEVFFSDARGRLEEELLAVVVFFLRFLGILANPTRFCFFVREGTNSDKI